MAPQCISLPGSRPANISLPVLGSDDRRVDPLCGRDLRRRQAARTIAFLAREHGRIELAAARISDESVFESINGITLVERCLVQHRVLAGRDEARGILVCSLHRTERLKRPIGAVVARSAGDDAIEILRESLRFHERHATTARTAVEVRQPGRGAIERRNCRLTLHRSLMNRAIAEVDEFLRMPDREARVGARVAGIG